MAGREGAAGGRGPPPAEDVPEPAVAEPPGSSAEDEWSTESESEADGAAGGRRPGAARRARARRRARSALEREYERLGWAERADALRFEPMLPRVYELTLPSLDARLNFLNVGQRHAAFLRHVYGPATGCAHAALLREKVRLFAAILTKILDVNGILERREGVADE